MSSSCLCLQGPYISSKQTAASVKAEVVDHARQKWPMFFSRFFEVAKTSGNPPVGLCVPAVTGLALQGAHRHLSHRTFSSVRPGLCLCDLHALPHRTHTKLY